MSGTSAPRILIYLLRRDLRLADNPVLNEVSRLASLPEKPFTHLLPVFVFPAQQVEVSGFLSSDTYRSPYPEARSQVAGFWRCGQHRAKFLAESVWDLKKSLETVAGGEGASNKSASSLIVRVGLLSDVVRSLVEGYREATDKGEPGAGLVSGLWMTSEEGIEEKREERAVQRIIEQAGAEFQLWTDEKYFIDDRDLPFKEPRELSDVFTNYRKTVEPLRDAPREVLPRPKSLLPLPPYIPIQSAPFTIPDSLEGIISALHKPLSPTLDLQNPPRWAPSTVSVHPFEGGETEGISRIEHLIRSGSAASYKDTRNGLLGLDYSTKLSGWLALGCITAREVHQYLVDYENGLTDLGKGVQGYGKGENKGTAAIRFELLWRDYMRLCTRKFGPKLFHVEGFREDDTVKWKYMDSSKRPRTTKRRDSCGHVHGGSRELSTEDIIERFLSGNTGMGLIDASQRELYLTGYTSNRARQNVASYLSKHLGVDWRIGAEWYETNLIDYDVSSNWGNWQYVAGVGNDPRTGPGGTGGRVFNPVKQAMDYDKGGEYVKAWIPELRRLGETDEELLGVFQPWRLTPPEKERLGIWDAEWVQRPLVRIDFKVGRGGGRGTGRRGSTATDASSNRSDKSEGYRGRGRGGYGYRGRGYRHGKTRSQSWRTGDMEKAEIVSDEPVVHSDRKLSINGGGII